MVILSMEYEIIDAVESYYKGDIETQIDIITWLKRITRSVVFETWLESNHSCIICDSDL